MPEVREECRRDSPCGAALGECLLATFFGLLGVHDFVEASQDVPAGYVLEGLAGLQEEAAVRHFDLDLLVVAEPYEEAGVP